VGGATEARRPAAGEGAAEHAVPADVERGRIERLA